MSEAIDTRWTIEQLGAQVALALAVDYPGPANGRVREVPDPRTIRYYTTLGLIDRPKLRGRTALYGTRHLLQLVALKRLQAKGLSLAEVQARLVGQPEGTLRRLARIQNLEALMADQPAVPPDEPARPREERFWTVPPRPVADQDTESPASSAPPLQGIPLGEDVLLLLPAARPVDEDDVASLRTAAAPLLKFLHRRRLLRPPRPGGSHDEDSARSER